MQARAPSHLYVVEDDAGTRELIGAYLEKNGFAVTAMASAEEMLQRIHRSRPDLIVLDVGLPGLSGLQACQRLRGDGDSVPIIMVTARSDEIDRVLGLEIGADDYLGKPFSSRELLARTHALLRRAVMARGSAAGGRKTTRIGEYAFSADSRSLHRGDEVRVLNPVECALLAELTANPSVAISRERLMAASHRRDETVQLRAVDAAVMRLRKLVEPNPSYPRYLQTVRGRGYMFVPIDAFVRQV